MKGFIGKVVRTARNVASVLPVVLLFLVIPLATGCSEVRSNGKVNKVERVFLNDTNDFTLLYRDGDSVLSKRFKGVNAVKIVEDVKTGEPMWAEYKGAGSSSTQYLELHVTSVQVVNGGTVQVGHPSDGKFMPAHVLATNHSTGKPIEAMIGGKKHVVREVWMTEDDAKRFDDGKLVFHADNLKPHPEPIKKVD